MIDRNAAERRANQIRAFRAELDALEGAGRLPLTAEQKAAIADYHTRLLRGLAADFDVDRSDDAGRLSRGMRILSLFGAATLTAAVYSLVERFWGGLDLPLQATLLAAFPLMSLVGVELSARRERTLYVASLFALVAYGTFWLAIGVLSWTVNIPVTPAYIWAAVVFGIALAIPYRFHVILAFALAALALAMAGTLFQLAGSEWTQAVARPDLLTVAGFSLLLLAGALGSVEPRFATVTRLVGFGVGLLGLFALAEVSEWSLLPLAEGTIAGIYQTLMLIASVTALVLGVRRGWHETVGLTSTLLSLFLLTRYVDWFYDLLPRYLFFLFLAAIAFVWLLALKRLRARLEGAAR